MVQPAYTLLAQSISQDRDSNAISLFHVIERVALWVPAEGDQVVPNHPDAASTFRGAVVSVWIKGESDFGRTFQYELALVPPGDNEQESIIGKLDVKFSDDRSKQLERIVIRLIGFPMLPKVSGIVWLESRIRKASATNGDAAWVTQRYALPVDVNTGHPSTKST